MYLPIFSVNAFIIFTCHRVIYATSRSKATESCGWFIPLGICQTWEIQKSTRTHSVPREVRETGPLTSQGLGGTRCSTKCLILCLETWQAPWKDGALLSTTILVVSLLSFLNCSFLFSIYHEDFPRSILLWSFVVWVHKSLCLSSPERDGFN